MKYLRRMPALLLALILALGVGFGLAPTTLLAAPAAQGVEDPAVTGYYESDVLESADSPGLVVGLILYEDGSADVISDYMNDEDVIVEVGTWVDNGDDTVTLTVTGTVDGAYEAPIELVFEMDEDGSLVVPGEEGGAFGEEGLTLLPTELGTEETESEPSSTADQILSELPEDALVYQSEVMAAADSPGMQITLVVFDDGSLAMVSDYMNEEDAVVEIGTWAEGDDGSLVITLTGPLDDEAYEEPLELAFTLNEDDSLALIDEGGVLFGDEGLTLLPISADAAGDDTAEEGTTEEETDETVDTTPSGAYVSDLLTSEDESGTFLVGVFYDDGSLLVSTYTLTGDLPILEVGTWTDNGDGTYTILATGTVDEDYDKPVEVEISVEEDGTIVLSGIPLYPLGELDLAADMETSLVAEFQSDMITYTSDITHTISLSFYDDMSAEMVTEYPDDGEILAEYGEWDISEDGQLLLTITGDDETDYEEPVEWIFDIADDGTLTLANDDEGFYGDEGLILLPLEIDQELIDAEAAAEEEATTEESDDVASADLENVQLFQSEVLPAATGEGLQLTLGLLDDGSAAMDYDYLDGEEVATNFGAWVDNEDGTFTVTFTEGPTGELEAPIELTLELDDDGNLTIIDATEESVGLLDVVLAPFALE